MPLYIDVHSHLQFPEYDSDRADVLARMHAIGVQTITVGTDLKTSQEAAVFAAGKRDVFATIGLHPNSAGTEVFAERDFKKLVADANVVGIGECGLDYYRNDPTDRKVVERQHETFQQQAAFADAHKLPLMIHCRPSKNSMDAYRDLLELLKAFPNVRGNVHFFVGSTEIAKGFLDIGFTVSLTGVVTFAREYDGMISYLPLDSILTETDAPYAAPVPHRGKRNEPSYVVEIVRAIAGIRNEDEEVVRSAVAQNGARVFGIGV